MTHFNQKRFDDPHKAAEFIVDAHDDGQTVTVDNGDNHSAPHMHSHQEYEVAQRDDGMVGVKPTNSNHVYVTPEGTFVVHSG
jgi:hypothetical protein